jgi:monoamine oxidase
MSGLLSEVDVAVIGAGSAGIAAGRRLVEADNLSVILLEARERAGGRAWTVDGAAGPMDLGCEWLHSADRNVLAPLAEELGFTINRRRPEWTTRLRFSGESEEAQAEWQHEREAFYWAVRCAAREPKDRPAATLLPPGGRWNALLDASSTWGNAVELESLSVKDYSSYEDSGLNWRLLEGYGRLFMRLAQDIPIAYSTAVSRIDHAGRRLRTETNRGVIEAARVIIAVPTNVIADEHLVFDPPLPDKVAAADALPLGLANKLFLAFSGSGPDPENELFVIGSTHRRETMNYQIRPLGRPRINCFFGGRFAAQLEGDGIAAMAAFATDELAALFGNDIRRQLSPLASSAWRSDPFARGSYSYARPGYADQRAVLAAPVDDRLFFAGEACSPNFFSTAHGAYETGLAAADAVLRSLS